MLRVVDWTGPIRVASIPAAHPYIRHLAAPDGPDPVIRLVDPPPDVPDPLPGQWWPPVMLQPEWVAQRHREFDLAHLHFGFDAVEPADLRRWLTELRRHRRPLVFTVHDLANPHFIDQTRHLEQLDVLIPAAAEVITLTQGAAAAIERRWGRTARVVPHPHVVPLAALRSPDRAVADQFLIGVHAKSLRANLDPLPVLVALEVAIGNLPAARIRVDVHPDLMTRSDRPVARLREWLQHRASDPRWQISVHSRFDDDELWAYLGALDLCVLPYRFGTHSGWLEACVDVGTAVLVPSTGHYADQHGHPTYPRSASGPIEQSGFTEILRRIYLDRALARPPRPDRTAQRHLIAAAHERIYRRALDLFNIETIR